MKSAQRTNSHHNQETCTEFPKIHNRVTPALDEIIWVGASSANPVWQRGEHEGRDDEEGVVFVEEGAGEDDEEEADC